MILQIDAEISQKRRLWMKISYHNTFLNEAQREPMPAVMAAPKSPQNSVLQVYDASLCLRFIFEFYHRGKRRINHWTRKGSFVSKKKDIIGPFVSLFFVRCLPLTAYLHYRTN